MTHIQAFTHLLSVTVLLLAAAGCGSESPGPETSLIAPAAAMTHDPAPPEAIFTEAAAASGLDFVHFNGMSGAFYFCEMVGPGVALFDYDNDGDLDVYAVQGGMLGEDSTPWTFPPPDGELRDRLYRNDLVVLADGSRRLRFTDVTAASGLEARGYGMGVATGDVDGDGWTDLYVTNFGANQMWRNRGDGTFEDVTAATDTGDPEWSVSAAFADVDRDGRLDLYVANYVDYSLATDKPCRAPSGTPEYCGPLSYQPAADRLFLNRSAGGRVAFEDVTAAAGLGAAGAGLGVTAADFDGDGWLDLYVANDGTANRMWMNLGAAGPGADVAFRDRAFSAGSAVNGLGQAEASMGVAAGDVDRDGDEDLFMTHLTRETNTLYLNHGGLFDDASRPAGVDLASWDHTGFGTGWLDFDNDGWLDLLAVNGAVKTLPDQVAAGDRHPLRQPNQLFRNLGGEGVRLLEVSARAGDAFATREVSRGAAFGDVDNDGDTDVLIGNNAGPLRLLINDLGQHRPWLGLRLTGGEPERDMLGAWVGAVRRDGVELWRRVATAGSYASASDPRILVGLGDEPAVDRVLVHWPDGAAETFAGTDLEIGRYHVLRQGEGGT